MPMCETVARSAGLPSTETRSQRAARATIPLIPGPKVAATYPAGKRPSIRAEAIFPSPANSVQFSNTTANEDGGRAEGSALASPVTITHARARLAVNAFIRSS